MALLDSFKTSNLTINKDPQKYSQVSRLDNVNAGASILDIDSRQPSTYSQVSKLDNPNASTSQLNRDDAIAGKSPQKYTVKD